MLPDIVLTKPGIHVVRDAIKEGRKIFERTKNYAIYRISENIRLIGLVAIMTLVLGGFPLTPIQLVLLAVLNDIPILMISIDRVKEPRNPAFFKRRPLFLLSSILGGVGVATSLILYYLAAYKLNLPLPQIQTLFFLKLVLSGHFLLLCVRSKEQWYKHMPHPLLLTALLATEIIGTLLAAFGIFMPVVHWSLLAFLWLYCSVWMQVVDLTKLIAIYKFGANV